ncbi:MAG: lysylphosphatidylglycerol synthase transmembrane domain-containing protein [Verrucomicrobiota bacterium]
MSALKKVWKLSWQIGLCLLLLTWIFHSIFLKEGRLAAKKTGLVWEQLTRIEQWEMAWTTGSRELWKTVILVHPGALALSLVLVGMTILLGVIRWRLVLKVQGLDLPLSRATGITFVAQFFNSFLLGSTGGDLIKAYYAARETHHKKTEAVVTVFVDRLLGLWSMLLFAALMMIPNFRLLFSHEKLGASALVILALLAGCTAVLSVAFWGGISRPLPNARNWLRKLPKGELLERSLDSCRQFGRHRLFMLKTIALSMALNAVCVVQVITLAHGLNLNIPPTALFVIVPIIVCISAMPITPSGLGVRENLFVLMLAAPEINIPEKSALALSLLTYGGSLFWSLVGGVVYLGLKKKEHLEEVTAANVATENA